MPITVPAPRESTVGRDIMNFLLGLSTLEEQKKSRKVRESEVEIARGELKLGTKRFRALKGMYQAQAAEATARAQQMDIDNWFKIEHQEITRQQKRAAAMGSMAEAETLKMKAKELSDMSPEERRRTLFAVEMLRNSQSAIEALKQQTFGLQSQLDMTKMMAAQKDLLHGDQLRALQSILTPETVDSANAAIEALKGGDGKRFGQILGEVAGDARTTETEKLKRKPSQLFQSEIDIFDSDSLAELKHAEDNNMPMPEYRYIRVPRWGGLSSEVKGFTEKQARAKGFGDVWDAAAGTSKPSSKSTGAAKPKAKAGASGTSRINRQTFSQTSGP